MKLEIEQLYIIMCYVSRGLYRDLTHFFCSAWSF